MPGSADMEQPDKPVESAGQPEHAEGTPPAPIEVAYQGVEPSSQPTGGDVVSPDASSKAAISPEVGPETEQSTTEGSEPAEPTPVEDKLWDHDKAETLAAVVHPRDGEEESLLDTTIKSRNEHAKNIGTQSDFIRDDALVQSARNKRRYAESHDRPKEEIDEAKRNEHQTIEDAAHHYEKEQEDIEGWVGGVIDEELSPYEEVYDVNPERFAAMPTSEFMEVVEQLREIDSAIHSNNFILRAVDRTEREIDEALEEHNDFTANSGKLIPVLQQLAHALSMDDATYESERAKLDYLDDSWGNGAEARFTRGLEILKSYRDRIKTANEEPRQRRQAFLDSLKPTPEAA